jgi:hypothetical protein
MKDNVSKELKTKMKSIKSNGQNLVGVEYDHFREMAAACSLE